MCMKNIFKKNKQQNEVQFACEQACNDFEKLSRFVESWRGTFEELRHMLDGYNRSPNENGSAMFMCNYNSITATIYAEKDKFVVSNRVAVDSRIDDLKKLI